MKKIIKLRNVAILIVCLAASSAFAQSGTTGPLTWNLNNGTLTISGNGDMPSYFYYSDNPWYEYRESIHTVVIETGVTSIGDFAFEWFTHLTSVTIPGSVTSIGWDSFGFCTSLPSVTIPYGVTTIKNEAFMHCINLTSVTIPNSVSSIWGFAFGACYNLLSVVNLNPVPVVIDASVFSGLEKSACTLQVLMASVPTYEAASEWQDFNIVGIGGETYDITLSANPSTGGAVFGGGIDILHGTEVTVCAIPSPCYTFVNWMENGAVVSTNACYTLIVTGNHALVANFELETHKITVLADPPEGGTVTGSGIYLCGEAVTVTATPNDCYTFVGWMENGEMVSLDMVYEFQAHHPSLTDDRVLTANFELESYEITVVANSETGGTVTGGGIYLCGEIVTVTATPNPDCEFISWTDENGVLVSMLLSLTFTVTDSHTFTANFDCGEGKYNIILYSNPQEAGEVIGGGTYSHGEVVTVSAVPNPDYDFVNWLEDGMEILAGSDYTFTVTGSRALTGNFETYDIVILSSTPDCGVSGGGNYRPGIEITVSANTRGGNYEFVNWTKDGVEVSTDADYTFITPLANLELVANFKETSVGIGEIGNDGISVYPNPTKGEFRVSSFGFNVTGIEIFDVMGRVVYTVETRLLRQAQQPLASLQDDTTTRLDISHLPTGVYFMQITTDKGTITKRIVKH